MERIQRVSRYVSWALMIFLALSILSRCFGMSNINMGYSFGGLEGVVRVTSSGIHSFAAQFFWISGDFVEALPLWIGLLCLIQIFQRYARLEIFTLPNVRAYRTIGVLFFAQALVASPLAQALHVFGETWDKGAGQRLLSIGYGTTSLENLLYGAIILTISWVMAEAIRLQDDAALTV